MATMATMRAVLLTLLTASVVCAQEDPVELYKQGRYREVATALRKVLSQDKNDAMLNYNLATTLWRLREADEAETAAEKAATLSEGRLDALRDGILGNLRFEAALKKAAEETKDQPPSKILEQALGLMVQARKHYQRGAVRPQAGPALGRNLERAIRKEEELRKELEEQKKKEEEQQKQDQKKDQGKKDQGKKDQGKKDQDKKDQQKKDQQKKDQNKQDQQKQQPPRLDEFDPKKELTKEQKKRLLERLKEIEAQLRELQKQKKARRPRVKKDW